MQTHNLITKKTNRSLNILGFTTTIRKSTNLSKKEVFLYKNLTLYLVKQTLLKFLLILFINSTVTAQNKDVRVMSIDMKTLNSSH